MSRSQPSTHRSIVADYSSVAFTFDRAERLDQVSQADTSGNPGTPVLKTFTFAAANGASDWANGKLRASRMVTPWTNGTATDTETFTYGGVGGAVSAVRTDLEVSGATAGNFTRSFNQEYTWTALGQLATQRYPTCLDTTGCPPDAPDRTVVNGYSNGYLTSVGPYYATALSYHPNGMLQQVTHARRVFDVEAGFAEVSEAEPNAMRRPRGTSTTGVTLPGTGGSGNWSTGPYAFDGAGNIKAMGTDSSFVYDGVSRLVRATLGGFVESYTYDAFGNMVTYAGRALSPSATTNRMTAAGSEYDKAGNLTKWRLGATDFTAAFDRLNQQIAHTGYGINRLFGYTAAGERVLVRDQLAGQATTITLRDLGGHVVREITRNGTTWSWQKDNIYRGEVLLATQGKDQGLRHVAVDHLGSPRLLTNRTGEKLKLFSTNAWGKDTTGTPQHTERMRYTVHERDLGMLDRTSDDLDYMHARSYAPMLARFLSVDPVRLGPGSPQRLNLYSYVRGRPMTAIDPQGLLDFVAEGGATAEDVAKAYALQEKLRKALSKALVRAYMDIFNVNLYEVLSPGTGQKAILTWDMDNDVRGINGRYKVGLFSGDLKLNVDRKLFDRLDDHGNTLFEATLLHEVGHWARKHRFCWGFRSVPTFPVSEELRREVMNGISSELQRTVRADGPEGYDSEILQFGSIVTLQWGP